MENLYNVLGIYKTATVEEIKKAYHEKAKEFHPDLNVNSSSEKFHEIKRAYEILSDPIQRKQYDSTGYISCDNNELYRQVFNFIKTRVLQYLEQGELIFTKDVIKEMTIFCQSEILALKGNIIRLTERKKFLNRVNKRFNKKKTASDDNNIISVIFMEENELLNNEINNTLQNIKILTLSKQYINDYNFSIDLVLEQPIDGGENVSSFYPKTDN